MRVIELVLNLSKSEESLSEVDRICGFEPETKVATVYVNLDNIAMYAQGDDDNKVDIWMIGSESSFEFECSLSELEKKISGATEK